MGAEPDAMRYPHLWILWAEEQLRDKQLYLESLREAYRHGHYLLDERDALVAVGVRVASEVIALECRIKRAKAKLGIG